MNKNPHDSTFEPGGIEYFRRDGIIFKDPGPYPEPRPKSVTVDGREYTIVDDAAIEPDPTRKSQNYQEDGETDVSLQRIAIKPGMADAYTKDIVTHEIIHVLWEHAGLTAAGGPSELVEEQVVTALAYRLRAFLRENPAMVKWLSS